MRINNIVGGFQKVDMFSSFLLLKKFVGELKFFYAFFMWNSGSRD